MWLERSILQQEVSEVRSTLFVVKLGSSKAKTSDGSTAHPQYRYDSGLLGKHPEDVT